MPFCWSINRRITKVVIWHICEVQGLNMSKQKFMGYNGHYVKVWWAFPIKIGHVYDFKVP